MADQAQTGAAELAKRRRAVTYGLVGVLVVVAALAGTLYVTGIDPLGLLAGAADSSQTGEGPASSAETSTTPVAAEARVPLPPPDARRTMFWEQVASAEQIESLVADEIGAFEFGQVTLEGDVASLPVRAVYRDGSSLSGTLVLRQHGGAWYFARITRDGNPPTTPVRGDGDEDVISSIVEAQAANQEVPRALVSGAYSGMTISRVTRGSGTAMMDVTFIGPAAGSDGGQVTCIRKEIDGTTYWFIASFSAS